MENTKSQMRHQLLPCFFKETKDSIFGDVLNEFILLNQYDQDIQIQKANELINALPLECSNIIIAFSLHLKKIVESDINIETEQLTLYFGSDFYSIFHILVPIANELMQGQ